MLEAAAASVSNREQTGGISAQCITIGCVTLLNDMKSLAISLLVVSVRVRVIGCCIFQHLESNVAMGKHAYAADHHSQHNLVVLQLISQNHHSDSKLSNSVGFHLRPLHQSQICVLLRLPTFPFVFKHPPRGLPGLSLASTEAFIVHHTRLPPSGSSRGPKHHVQSSSPGRGCRRILRVNQKFRS